MARIMIVEDEPITAADLEQKLMALGHDVTAWLDTGEEALQQAQDACPDLVLMDIRLRGQMNGIETARRLRERSDVPIVFLTAFADPATVTLACETEPYGYLLKPFTQQSVATALQVALSRVSVDRTRSERERWAAAALHEAGEGLIAVGADGVIRFINEPAETMLMVKAADVLGRACDEVVRFDEPSDGPAPLQAALAHGQVTSSSTRALLRADGKKLNVAYSAAPVFAPGSVQSGAVLVFRETTPPLAIKKSGLDAVSTLSSRLSHEINNPLTYNLAAVSLALKELDKVRALGALSEASEAREPKHEERLARIEGLLRGAYEGGTRVAGVIRELGAFSITSGEMGPVRSEELLDLAMGLGSAEHSDRVRLSRQVRPAPMIWGNKWQLARLLAFLLESSVESLAAQGAGTVVFSLDTDKRGWTVYGLRVHKDPVVLQASHEGRSVRAIPGTRSTSVGMTLAEQIVESQGGEFDLVEKAEGRTLEIRLPPVDLATLNTRLQHRGGTRRSSVLVIDDEPTIGQVLTLSLEPEHDVTAVESAEQGLSLLERGDAFDVILCDLTMPGMSGQDFFEHLQTFRPELADRVILMSGGATSEAARRFLHAHRDQYIAKPFQTDQLLRLIAERAMGRGRTTPRASC